MSYHVGNLGMDTDTARRVGITVDLDGYAPMPGDGVDEFRWEASAWDEDSWVRTMREGKAWSGQTWTDLCEANARATAEVEMEVRACCA